MSPSSLLDDLLQRPLPDDAQIQAASRDKAPDGWRVVTSSKREALFLALDRSAYRATVRVSRQVSRRTFLNRAAKAGLAISAGVSGVLWGPAPRANATFQKCNVYVTGGDYNDGACGPSDECGAVECDGAGDGSCNAGHVCGNSVVVKGRATFVNNSCGTEFFWYECCPNGGFKCTDCCGCKYHPGATCEQEGGTSSCVAPHPHYKCICEKKTTDTCQVG